MNELKKNTYIYQVKKWLEDGNTITSKQAIDKFGCTRLAVVISVLRHGYGMPIKSEEVRVKNRNNRWVTIAKYFLVTEAA